MKWNFNVINIFAIHQKKMGGGEKKRKQIGSSQILRAKSTKEILLSITWKTLVNNEIYI